MTIAYIDSASILGVIFALRHHGQRALTSWETQSLFEATYLLMHPSVYIVPGPWRYVRFRTLLRQAFGKLPAIPKPPDSVGRDAVSYTKSWLGRNPGLVRDRWAHLQSEPNFANWLNDAIELFWVDYARLGHGLFSIEFVPQLSKIIGCSESELSVVHSSSKDDRTVTKWVKEGRRTEDAQIAERAFALSTLVRGRTYEHVAKELTCQFIPHPLRDGVALPTTRAKSPDTNVHRSELFFTAIVVGSALLEASLRDRTTLWAENVVRARDAIDKGFVELSESDDDVEAEQSAVDVAKQLGFPSRSRLWRAAMDFSVSTGAGVGIAAFTVQPWAGLSVAVGLAALSYVSKSSIGEELARFGTKRRFLKLARSVAGRVQPRLKTKSKTNDE